MSDRVVARLAVAVAVLSLLLSLFGDIAGHYDRKRKTAVNIARIEGEIKAVQGDLDALKERFNIMSQFIVERVFPVPENTGPR